MDLSDLRHTLGERDAPTAREASTAAAAAAADGGAVAEVLARHRGGDAASARVRLVLESVLDVVRAEGLSPTPTALFAALTSALARPEAAGDAAMVAAMCAALGPVLARVPTSVLRSRFAPLSALLADALERHGADDAAARAALPCLCVALSAADAAAWPAAGRPFALLLEACLDARPRVRRRAAAGLVETLAAAAAAPAAAAAASDALLRLCQRVLPAPEAAARAAAAAPARRREAAEEAITRAVSDALHLLAALKAAAPVLAAPAAQGAAALALALLPLRQPLLTRAATDALAVLVAAPASRLAPATRAALLAAVLDAEASWDARDVTASLHFIALVEGALLRLAEDDAGAALAALPRAVHALVPRLAAEHEGARLAAQAALRNAVDACVGPAAVAATLAPRDATAGRALPPLQRVVAAVAAALGPQYRDGWEGALGVAAELLEALGPEGAPLAGALLDRLGQLCAGGDDAAEAGGGDEGDARALAAARAALGAALRALGPEAVLAALPLNVREALAGRGEARGWMLPLLRAHVRGARLGYWARELLPLAREMGARAAAARAATAADPGRAREAQLCGTLEAQLWGLLPAFASWPRDVGAVFGELSVPLAETFQKRPDLRVPIAHALRRLCAQTRAALAAAGEPVGHADPSARREAGGDDEEDEKEEEDDADPDAVPPHATAKATRRALAALRAGARGWMPLLLDATLAAPPHQRGPLEAAASAYACACDAPTVAALFRSAVGQLVAAGGGGAGDDPERRAALLGVALALAGGLDAVGAEVLYRAALPGAAARHPALQKRSYKALAYLCESRPDFFEPRFGEVVAALLAASGAAASAAKRHRLRCLKAAALELLRPGGPDVDPAALPGVAPPPPPPGGFPSAAAARGARARAVLAPLLAEIVLGVKETNKRSRGAAYALLIEVAGAAHAAEPPGGPGGGGLRALFGLLLAGLAGATPHMVSATVVALARLLFEYAPVLAGLVPELLPAVLGLLRSPAREVVKSALGFVKVAALRLPADELARFVPGIVEGCLLWAEDSRNKFRAKVRSILERLVARVGIAPVEAAAPESARRLLAHLRRQLGRRERRRRSEAGSRHGGGARGGGGGDDDARSRRTRGERTAAPSRWDSEALDSEEEDGDGDATFRGAVTEGARSHGARTARGDGPARTLRRGARTERGGSERGGGAGGARRLPAGGDPLDLLDAAASRRLVRAGGGRRAATAGRADDDDEGGDFERDARGRMLIRDEDAEAAAAAGAKRKRGGAAAALGVDSDDSDAEEFKGFSGLDLALRGARSVGAAPSLGGRSAGGRSAGGASRGGGRGGRGGGRSGGRGGGRAAPRRGPQHSGDRFRARGAAGDVRGRSAVEPYAYWPLDRSMLNRRAAKQRQAKLGLGKVVSGGAAKGGKGSARGAKRARHSDA